MRNYGKYYMGHKGTNLIVILSLGILLLSFLLALSAGVVYINLSALFSGLAEGDSTTTGRILLYVRLPRLLAAVLAGAGLSTAGMLLQTVLSNPLASPGIIGVNAGAGLSVTVCMVLFPAAALALPLAAFVGALTAVLLVFGIARCSGASKITLILSGVAVSSLMSAGINTFATMHPDILGSLRDFQNGSLSGVSMQPLIPAGIAIAVGVLASLEFSEELEVLGLGESTASSLGLPVRFYRSLFLILAAILAGAAVSFAGLLGFIGLMVPHMSRFILRGAKIRTQLMLSALLGSSFLLLCDTAARTLFSPFELPVGILMAYLGVPFFLWLLLKERRKQRND